MIGFREQFQRVITDSLSKFGKPEDIGRITPCEVLEDPSQSRSFVSRARANILRSLFTSNGWSDGQPILEIGTGTGELTKLLAMTGPIPNMVYSDIDTERVKKHLGDDTQVLELDIEKTGLPDSSQKAVVVYNLLDQFVDLSKPCSELSRIIDKGGSLLVLTDLQPDEFMFFRHYPDSYLIPFPQQNNNQNIPYVALSQEEAYIFADLQPPGLKEFWLEYMNLEPWQRAFISRLSSFQHMSGLKHNLEILYLQRRLGFEPKIIDMAFDFHRRADASLTEAGFPRVTTNLVSEQLEGFPLGKQNAGSEYDYAFDRLLTKKDQTLGNKVREIAKIGVISASK